MKAYEVISSSRLGDTEALYPSDTIYSGLLTSGGGEQTVTVPTGADFCIFAADGDFYVNYDTTAAVPTGTISEAGGELNPDIRYVGETTTLHIIASGSVKITLQFFSKTDV
jgi:hypothetical protein